MLVMSVSPLAVCLIFERYDRPMRVSSVGCSMKPTFQPQASPFRFRSASPLVATGKPAIGTTVFFL
ncbi:hypothetical protein D3C77_621160 [compost metagenome]